MAPSGVEPKVRALGDGVAEVDGVLELALATTDTTGLDGALLVKVMTPVTEPGFWGANEMVTVMLAPAANVRGNDGLTIVNPLPLIVAADTSVLAVPGFDIVRV